MTSDKKPRDAEKATRRNSKASAKKQLDAVKATQDNSKASENLPLDANASASALPSKKQKVSGEFSDQNIEHLNDVTANCGVDLNEEKVQLFSDFRDSRSVSKTTQDAEYIFLQKVPLQKKLAEIMKKSGLKNWSNDVEQFLSWCVEGRMRGLISSLIEVSKQRVDSDKTRHPTVVTSDVRSQIIAINRKAREEQEKKQAEAEKLQPDSSNAEVDKEKDVEQAKPLKLKEKKVDKMCATAANAAVRATVGMDDFISRWKLMAQARGRSEDATTNTVTLSVGNVGEIQGLVKDHSATVFTSGVVKQGDRSAVALTRHISIKDVTSVLEREPQMAKSLITYRLYERVHADPAVE